MINTRLCTWIKENAGTTGICPLRHLNVSKLVQLHFCSAALCDYPYITGKPSSQSSMWRSYDASFGNNGIYPQEQCEADGGNVFYTNYEINPWWRVDLVQRHLVLAVNMLNVNKLCSWSSGMCKSCILGYKHR